MACRSARLATSITTVALVLLFRPVAGAQGRTDVVTLANGDRITGEVVRLERGRLEFKTDDAGTLYLEWDKLVSVVTTRVVEAITVTGDAFVGALGRAADRAIAVIGADRTTTLPMPEVTRITTIGQSFWKKLDGSIDSGFNYTKSSGVAQLNLHSDTVYRKPRSQLRLTASLTLTEKSDGSGRDDRGAVEASYLRYQWPRWFIIGLTRFESNESLGIELRSQAGGAIGPRLVNSNRAQLTIGAGAVFNDERGLDVPATQNVDGLLRFNASYYTYDRPRTNLDVIVQYFPSLTNFGRHRLQVDAAARREFWKDLFLSLSVFDSFDSRPPNPASDRNDVGVVASVGWSY